MPVGSATWLAALGQGASFGDAHDTALSAAPDFDLGNSLSLALRSHALAKVNHKELK
jgi:hypothetical protein